MNEHHACRQIDAPVERVSYLRPVPRASYCCRRLHRLPSLEDANATGKSRSIEIRGGIDEVAQHDGRGGAAANAGWNGRGAYLCFARIGLGTALGGPRAV